MFFRFKLMQILNCQKPQKLIQIQHHFDLHPLHSIANVCQEHLDLYLMLRHNIILQKSLFFLDFIIFLLLFFMLLLEEQLPFSLENLFIMKKLNIIFIQFYLYIFSLKKKISKQTQFNRKQKLNIYFLNYIFCKFIFG